MTCHFCQNRSTGGCMQCNPPYGAGLGAAYQPVPQVTNYQLLLKLEDIERRLATVEAALVTEPETQDAKE